MGPDARRRTEIFRRRWATISLGIRGGVREERDFIRVAVSIIAWVTRRATCSASLSIFQNGRPILPLTHKDDALIKFKNFLYFERKDWVEKAVKALKPLPGSRIECFKNGVSQGVAWEDIFDGTYYPAVSLYKNVAVSVNFGPSLICPPRGLNDYQPMNDVVLKACIEQTMADMMYNMEFEEEASQGGPLYQPPVSRSRT